MVVCLRLSTLGCRNNPFYRIIAADSKSRRDGKHLEVLGYYDPLPGQGCKRMSINFDRVKYWLSVGAQPSDPVQRLLSRAARDTRPDDPMAGCVMALAQQDSLESKEDPEVDDDEKSSTSK